MQAARQLNSKLKMLRTERKETQQPKKGRQKLEDTTMKWLSVMENSLRQAHGQMDDANASVRQLETENAGTRAEMGASASIKLSFREKLQQRNRRF